jgi:hypothetical protein
VFSDFLSGRIDLRDVFHCSSERSQACTDNGQASSWHTWMMLYSVPVLQGRLPAEYLEHWVTLIRVYDLCLKWEMNRNDLHEIRCLFVEFVQRFKVLYIDCDNHPKRPMLYSTNIHGLLHLHDQIRHCGPMFAWDEAGTETYMGMIGPMARSGVKIDESAANATFLEEMVKILSYARPSVLPKGHERHPRSYETEFGYLLPVVETVTAGDLTSWQRRLLKQYFRTLVGHQAEITLPQDLEIRKWARYQIKDEIQGQRLSGHKIGSLMSQRPGPVTRASHWIRYQLIDTREDRPDLFYGQVEFFVSLTVADVVRRTGWRRGADGRLVPEVIASPSGSSMDTSEDEGDDDTGAKSNTTACEHYLAYVRNWKTRAIDEDTGNRRVMFLREGPYEFVEVRSIDCSVGRLTTFEADWVVSGSVHPVRAAVDSSDDDETGSDDD